MKEKLDNRAKLIIDYAVIGVYVVLILLFNIIACLNTTSRYMIYLAGFLTPIYVLTIVDKVFDAIDIRKAIKEESTKTTEESNSELEEEPTDEYEVVDGDLYDK